MTPRRIASLMLIGIFMSAGAFIHNGCAQATEKSQSSENNEILVAYFSHTGNTREIANQIHDKVGGEIFEIKTVEPYVDNYHKLLEQAREELDADFRPELQSRVGNIDAYDVVFVGYPIWFGTYPMAVKTFLATHDLTGKTIAPFCTHEGSRLGRSVSDLETMCPDSNILEGFEARGGMAKSARDDVSVWLGEIEITD